MLDVSNDAYLARMAVVEAMAFVSSPTAIYRPTLSVDGDQWCFLFGDDLMTGVAGFGDTPAKAAEAFDRAWWHERTPAAHRAVRERATCPSIPQNGDSAPTA